MACASYGAFGDCTAFQTKGSNFSTYGPLLTKAGFHHSGNQVLYNGMSGDQIQANIYFGPTYYMRLKHMVKDKVNYRARGPNQQLTRQPVEGRANDGGLRVGEMERDALCAHGLSYFLNESFMVRGDQYYLAVCNKTGAISIYNEAKNVFLSPFADGPLQFHTNPDGSLSLKNLTKFGRSFSLLRVPYAFKLLMQELQTMNIQMRLITEDNVDQLMSMSYSNNISTLLNKPETQNKEQMEKLVKDFVNTTNLKMREVTNIRPINLEAPVLPSPVVLSEDSPGFQVSPDFQTQAPVEANPDSPPYAPGSSPPYAPGSSPPYAPGSSASPGFQVSQAQSHNNANPYSPPYAPGSPGFQVSPDFQAKPPTNANPDSPPYAPGSSPGFQISPGFQVKPPTNANPDSPPYAPGSSPGFQISPGFQAKPPTNANPDSPPYAEEPSILETSTDDSSSIQLGGEEDNSPSSSDSSTKKIVL